MKWHFGFVCNFCCAPEKLTDVAQLEHIRMEHLNHYKPYKSPQCDQNYAVEPRYKEHIVTTHNTDSIASDSSSSSQFLNVLGDMMMQCSFYNAIGYKQTATKLINAVKQNIIMQETKTSAQPGAPSEANSSSNEFCQTTDASNKFDRETVKSKKELSCEFCPRTFPSPSALRVHQDGAHNRISNAPNKCNKCEMRYHSVYNLRRHQKRHRVYKRTGRLQKAETECEFCDASFGCVSQLKMHQDNTVSSGANRCGKRYNFHNLRCHKPIPKTTPSAQPEALKSGDKGPAMQTAPRLERHHFQCPHCPLTFDCMSNWRVHQDSKHNRTSSGPYQCSVCSKCFYGYANYKRCHSYSIKVAQALACKLCSLKCTNANELRKHEEKEHKISEQTVLRNQEPLPQILKIANKFAKAKSTIFGCLSCNTSFRGTVADHLAKFHKGHGHVIDKWALTPGQREQLRNQILITLKPTKVARMMERTTY